MCYCGQYEYLTISVQIDKCLVPLIKTLNQYGIKTLACCCGHGEKPLENNRVVLVADTATVKISKNNGRTSSWKLAKDLGIQAISIPIIKEK